MRLIDADGQQAGIVTLTEALEKAETSELDLVEIAPSATPPVCRIMDYGKYLFEQSKRFKNKAKQIHLKEIKFRPVTDIGDYNVKVRKALDFLKDGDKVKFTVRFRGREIDYQGLGMEILQRAANDLKEHGTVEQSPKIEGRQITMVIVPAKPHHK